MFPSIQTINQVHATMTGNNVIKFKDYDTISELLQDAENCEKAVDLPSRAGSLKNFCFSTLTNINANGTEVHNSFLPA